MQKWCPIDDELLASAEWLEFDKRQLKPFMSVEYFVCRFPYLFEGMDMDLLAEQFSSYQVLPDCSVPDVVKTDIGLSPDDPHQVDALWSYLATRRVPGSNKAEFGLLCKVATAIMTIPHSNAGEERIFSLINKNKTPSRSSLQLENTLSSIVMVKTHIADPMRWKPSADVLKLAKKATIEYNQRHKWQ